VHHEVRSPIDGAALLARGAWSEGELSERSERIQASMPLLYTVCRREAQAADHRASEGSECGLGARAARHRVHRGLEPEACHLVLG
jgi:hypothetical protein